MNKEFSTGAVIFKKEGRDILFLMIYSARNRIWGFPKGHIEHGETEKEAAAREIREETGLEDLRFMEGFTEKVMYEAISTRPPFKGRKIKKYVTYFLCETKDRDVRVDGTEVTDHRFLPMRKAEELIRFRNLIDVLRKADGFLQVV